MYLAHMHCKEVYHWFTPDAVSEAKEMGWDMEKKQLISKDSLDLCTLIQSLELEWCIMPSPSGVSTSMVIDLDNITLPSFNTVNQHITTQPGTPSVAPNAIPQSVAPMSMDQDNSTLALTVDTHLSTLEWTCTLLPSIMQKLEALASPTPNNTVPGSTSTPTASVTPSMQGSALGKRD